MGAGIRASSTNVGYFPAFGALTEYVPGGTPPAGWAWDGEALISTGPNSVLNLALINGGCVVDDDGGAVITKSRIVCGPTNNFVGITLNGTNKGFLTVEDTTVVGNLVGTRQGNGISSDDGLIARRCHVTRTGDGIHFCSKTGTLISQCYVGQQRYDDVEQHCDGVQQFMDDANGSFTFEHSFIDETVSTYPGGLPDAMSAGMTMGPPVDTPPIVYTPTLVNNYYASGGYHLRFNYMCRNAVVTDNDFGPIRAANGEVAYHDFDPGIGNTYTTWSNNRNEIGNLIPAP